MACLSCLSSSLSKEGYCLSCRRILFDGIKIAPRLPFTKPSFQHIKEETQVKISLSGVQDKISLAIKDGSLSLVDQGGHYMLKPSITEYAHSLDSPANEHVTMQIAKQVYKFDVAHNGLIRFEDGELAYLVKRFDYLDDKTKLYQEDFCQLLEKSRETGGENYKYDGAYGDAQIIFEKFIKARIPTAERYFKQIVFNYLYHNGDAHFKNFSLYFKEARYQLTPCYDLMNTRLHLPHENALALHGGLYEGDTETQAYEANGFYTLYHFLSLGEHLKIKRQRVEKFVADLVYGVSKGEELVHKSFLSGDAKVLYITLVHDRVKALTNRSFC